MINTQSIAVNQSRIPVGKAAANQATGRSFAEYLENASDNESAIPDKWCPDTDKFGTGVEKAVKYMKDNLGIDPYNRTPTHEITDEQLQWLKSRHNLDDIYKTESGTCDDGCCGWSMGWWDENFLSDLVYLNVISPDEAKTFGLVTFPEHTAVLQKAESTGFAVGAPQYTNFADVLASALSTQQDLISYIQDKANDPTRSEAKDFDYLESALKNAERQRKLYEMLLGLYE